MTLYKGSTKIDDIYKGGTKIRRIYKGSQLVYTRLSITYSGSTGGTVSGENFWSSSGVNAYDRSYTGSINYSQNLKTGIWHFNIYTNRQKNTSGCYLEIKILYADGTNGQVLYKNDFATNSNGDNPITWDFTFNITKPWVGYQITTYSHDEAGVYCFFNVRINKIEYIEKEQPL